MSIAPDLDKLMWNIADSGEKDAAESFQKRFPELKHELSKRMRLVQDIKKAKALHLGPATRPEFRLKAKTESSAFKPSWRLVTATALILGAALVFAVSYSISRARASSNSSETRSNMVGAAWCPPTVKVAPGPSPHTRRIWDKQTSVDAVPNLNVKGQPDVQQPLTPTEPKSDAVAPSADSKDQRIIMKQVPLSTALHAISAQYGLKIDTAPGFPDPTIDLDSEDKDAISMLRDIGSKYNFGVVEEGDKSVLLVPQKKQ